MKQIHVVAIKLISECSTNDLTQCTLERFASDQIRSAGGKDQLSVELEISERQTLYRSLKRRENILSRHSFEDESSIIDVWLDCLLKKLFLRSANFSLD